jgi:hypothetical protein
VTALEESIGLYANASRLSKLPNLQYKNGSEWSSVRRWKGRGLRGTDTKEGTKRGNMENTGSYISLLLLWRGRRCRRNSSGGGRKSVYWLRAEICVNSVHPLRKSPNKTAKRIGN